MLRARRMIGCILLITFVSGCAYRPAVLPGADTAALPDQAGDPVKEGSRARVMLHTGEVVLGHVERLSPAELILEVDGPEDPDRRVIPVESIESVEVWRTRHSTFVTVLAAVGLGAILGGGIWLQLNPQPMF